MALSLIALLTACVQKPSLATQAFSPTPAAQPQILPIQSSPAVEVQAEIKTPTEPTLTGTTLTEQREIFLQGYRFFQEKNWQKARTFLTRALEVYPLLADYSLYYLGALSREVGQIDEARLFLQRVVTEYPDSIWNDRALLELAKLALADSNWSDAARYAEQARQAKSSSAFVRHDAMLVLAQAKEGQEDFADAYNLYQELRYLTPYSSVGKTAKTRVDHLRTTFPSRFGLVEDRDYLEEIRLLQKEGRDANEDELVRQFNARFSTSSLRSEVMMLIASLYKKQGRVNDAVATWKAVVEQYANSALAPAAMFNWASLLWNKDRDEEARGVFEQLTQQYPRHEKSAHSWYAIGRIWQERKDDARASAAYDRLATLFSDSQLAREGRWRQGWMAYRRGDFQQAAQLFSALAKSAGASAEGESALYWQARAQDRGGETEQASQRYQELLRRYPDGYYAVLVEKRLNITPSPLHPGEERTGAPPTLSPRLDGHYRRSQELVALGLPALARRELEVVKEGVPRNTEGSLFLLAEYNRMDGYAAALRLALALSRKESGSWLRYLYPQAYWPLINTHARQKGLDPYLVLALIRQESLFDPEAVSPAQAYGLMQLLPKTAARVTQTASVSLQALTTPEFNIRTGASYLRQLFKQFDGNAAMAVAAYNAGENAVEKWRARYPGLELDEFVESISYRETRNYVKLVLRNYRMYQRLYNPNPGQQSS
ncbi:MAG: transglycosylase SLT domain-containing protein [Candidatus Binatia bacterium]